ncbi:DUF6794 domain-containing protein [Methylomonas sp. UP202]|uniref:DUF6794 domain-containing protein n=1 Tax=Methylomonas sp. UP202 TaxID=3040943 RepID=UPI0032AF77C4
MPRIFQLTTRHRGRTSATKGSTLKLELENPPTTLPEAVDRLQSILLEEDKQAIAGMAVDDLYNLHFNLGLAIRNAWLNRTGGDLLTACGTYHPDDASQVILVALWRALQL